MVLVLGVARLVLTQLGSLDDRDGRSWMRVIDLTAPFQGGDIAIAPGGWSTRVTLCAA